jgi:hypothetical protein
MPTFWVGKNDGTIPVKTFNTLEEAEAEIATLEKIDPTGVHDGDYYIDGPGEE